MAYTRVLDGRWIESFAHHLRDVDNYMEMRKKLGMRPKAAPAPAIPPKAGAKGSSGKGRGKGSTEEQPDH